MNHLPTWLIFRAVNSLVLSSFQGGFLLLLIQLKNPLIIRDVFFQISPSEIRRVSVRTLIASLGFLFINNMTSMSHFLQKKWGHMSLLPSHHSFFSFSHNGFPTTFSAKFCESLNPRLGWPKGKGA